MSSEAAHRLEMESDNSGNEGKASQPLDIPAIMAEIRERVAEESKGKVIRRQFQPNSAHLDRSGHWKAGALQHSEELHYLNSHWQYASAVDLTTLKSHRSGIIGKLVVKLKRWMLGVVWESILKGIHDEERAYQMRLVQFLNNLSFYIDDRDGSNFWELIRKIDNDVSAIATRLDRIADEQTGTVRSVERSLTDSLNTSIRELSAQLQTLAASTGERDGRLATVESVASGLEGVVARLSRSTQTTSQIGEAQPIPVPPESQGDASYLLLENRFRGSEAAIRERMSHYVDVFRGVSQPVLDLGAGRGELLKLMRESGIPSYGVDPDSAMISVARENNLDIRLGDGIAHLRTLADGSLSGLIATQVVEHLSRAQLSDLLESCKRKVAAGGKVVFETINPKSLVALSSNYFRDPSHIFPMHPDTLSYAMTLAGIKVVEVRYLSPIPKEAQLKELEVDDYMTPRWAHAVTLLNQNIRQLNDLLYGYQDFCVIGEVTPSPT